MKKSSIIAALALAALVGCNKAEQPAGCRFNGEKVRLSVGISSPATKATTSSELSEGAVNQFQVFVFSANGAYEAKASSSSSAPVNITVSTGDKKVVALVNAPAVTATVNSLSDLEALGSSLTTDNTASGFVMYGLSETSVTAETASVTVNVSRLAARVKIHKITRKFAATPAYLQTAEVKLVRCYLAEVADNILYGGAPASYTWISSELNDPAAISSNALVTASLGNTALTDYSAATAPDYAEASYATAQRLYAYPNPTTADAAAAKCTRLVVEVMVGSDYYTYPILIPGIEGNKSYEINELVITKLGNSSDGDDVIDDSEDEPISSKEIPFDVTVNDWTLVLLGTDGVVTI